MDVVWNMRREGCAFLMSWTFLLSFSGSGFFDAVVVLNYVFLSRGRERENRFVFVVFSSLFFFFEGGALGKTHIFFLNE